MHIIITTQNFVVGIFAELVDAQHYLTLKPPEIESFVHTINPDLIYPFYLLEIGDNSFLGFQTDGEARAQGIGLIIYTIYEDYRPKPPWTDSMGNLDHKHLKNMED